MVVATTTPTDGPKPKKKKKAKPKFSVNQPTTLEFPDDGTPPGPTDGVRPTRPVATEEEEEEEDEEDEEVEEEAPPPPSGMFGKLNSGLRALSTRIKRATEGEFHYTPGFVLIKLRSRPSGAEVFYDGASIGKTPLSLDFERGTDPLSFKIALAGHEEQTHQLTPDVDGRVFAELVKIPVKIEVTVNSTPTGAEVHHEGQVLGKTPLKLDLMSDATPIKVVLKLQRYKDKALEIPRVETTSLSVKLDSACKKKTEEEYTRPTLIDPYDPCRER
jgi:hypothetical protein